MGKCDNGTKYDFLTKTLFDGLVNYLENTVEITKTIRLPKGETCDCCNFRKYADILYGDDGGCSVGGGVYCALYGERLQLKDALINSPVYATIPPNKWAYCKCKKCLDDIKVR